MSYWDDRLANHESRGLLKQLAEALEPLGPETTDELESLERAKKVLRVVLGIYEEVDPELVTAEMLSRIAQDTAKAIPAGDAYVADPTPEALETLNARLDDVLDAFEPVITAAPLLSPEMMRDAATAYRRSAGQLLRSLQEESEVSAGRIADVASDVERLRGSQQKLAADAETALDQLRKAVDSQETRLTAALTGFQNQFSDAEARRQQSAAEAQAALMQTASELSVEVSAGAEKSRTELDQAASGILGRLEEYRDEAARLVNAVGANAFAGGYGVYANEQRRAADEWRRLAVAMMAAVALLGAIYLFTVGHDDFSWQGFWIRAVIVLPLAFIAAYSAAQSGRHRRNEIRARQLALELLAIDPYLELLPVEERDKVKVRMADRFFGNPIEGDSGEDRMGVDKVLEAARDTLKRGK